MTGVGGRSDVLILVLRLVSRFERADRVRRRVKQDCSQTKYGRLGKVIGAGELDDLGG